MTVSDHADAGPAPCRATLARLDEKKQLGQDPD
jgi:hypothetical protein